MRRREDEQVILEGFHLNDLLVENTSEFAMFGLDLSGTILSWNPGVEKLLGYAVNEWVGQKSAIIFTEEDRAKHAPLKEFERAAREGETADVRWHLRKDGSRFWANGVMTALFTPAGVHIGYAKVIRDETDKKKLEVGRERLVKELREEHELVNALNTVLQQRVSEGMEELAEASAQLQREVNDRLRLGSELRSQEAELESLTYSISHDLRAPLRGLDGFSQALLEDYEEILDEVGKGYLRRIRSGAQLIGDLIDNLLELSRLSRRDMKWVEVDLSRLAKRVVDRLRRNSPNRNAQIVIGKGMVVTGDPDMLGTLLENLLGNAWKFTAREDVAQIEFGATDEEGERRFYVRDNGVGFDMRYAARLFAPFQRLHPRSEFEGSGIGLATVRRIVHRHGGSLGVDSEPGVGSTFWFSLGREPAFDAPGAASGLEDAEQKAGESAAKDQPD
ncbi:MAG TPA: ATP-binding protein [Trueperaceae bacterium]